MSKEGKTKEKNKAIGAIMTFTCGWFGLQNIYYKEFTYFLFHLVGPAMMVIPIILLNNNYNYVLFSVNSHVSASDPNYNAISILIEVFWLGFCYTSISYFLGIINFVRTKL